MKVNMSVLLMARAATLLALLVDNVDIKVAGRIIVAPCVFNSGNSNMSIDLGSIQAMNIFAPGSSSDPVSSNLLFTSYPPSTLSVTTRFSGTLDPEASVNYYQNSGTATHVAIVTSDVTTGTLMGNGSSITQNIVADRTTRMPMKVVVISVAERPTPGSTHAVIILTIQYN